MNGRTHLMLGLAVALPIAAITPPDTALRALVILTGGVGGLIADVDHPKSIISGYLPGVGGAVQLVASHRGPTHTIMFIALLLGLLSVIGAPQWIIAAAAGGLVSHLLADMLTVAGVPLFMPLSRRSFRLAPYVVLKATSWLLESVATVGAMAVIGLTIYRGIKP